MLSVIILAYNRLNHTIKCVESILNRTYDTPYELVLIYNNGNPDIKKYFKKVEKYFKYTSDFFSNSPFKNLITIYNKKNIGLQPGRNQGMKVATGDYMMWLDNDAWIEDNHSLIPYRPGDWLRKTDCLGRFVTWMKDLKEKDNITAIIGQTGGYWGPEKVKWRRRSKAIMGEVDAVMGYNVAFPREIYDIAGPIDSFYGKRGRQDTEFCFNAKYHGFKVFRTGYFGIGHDWDSKVTNSKLKKKFKENTAYMRNKWGKKKLNLVPRSKWIT